MTDTPILIGLTGRLGVGKSTLAAILAELIPGLRITAFADAIKTDVLRMVNNATDRSFTLDDLERDKATIWGPMLQGYGELCRQTFGADYWVDRLHATLPPRAVIADVRYVNEACWIKVQGGLLVYVDGPCRRDGDRRLTTHPSETGVDACSPYGDLKVDNSGSRDHLRQEAVCIARIARSLADSAHLVGAR